MTVRGAPFVIFAVSDGTGTTAERVIRAALTQFPQDVEVHRFGSVRTVEQIQRVVREAARARALVVHTLVSADLRQAMFEEGRRHHVQTLDLMGPLLERVSDLLGTPPLAQPGLYWMEDFNRRIEAVDFALRHDDGRNTEELAHAEIVLVGVSRTGKTPLSIYLAYRGWLVGNVPVVLEVNLPPILSRLPRERVIGLTVDPVRLAQLRQARLRRISPVVSEYADLRYIRAEVAYALDLFHRHGWSVVDMTSKPVEEAAAEVVALVTGHPAGQGEKNGTR
ncbi:MAG: pyruvate, water dikinase regulatory protein [Anaerolineae bacterium]|nr:kinase/pyrophosphorylase [Anaerolineae bacterium]MDW8068046.1 pyruvate, water dikinase regulatory protein [Anaerolineae bacterium]